MQPRQFLAYNLSVDFMINFAYGLQIKQITGGPPWLDTEKFDIVAKPDGQGQPNGEQWRLMVGKLLADRFKLKFHRDTKELSVYVLSVGKGGPKLAPSEGDPKAMGGVLFGALGRLSARNASMKAFVENMESAALDRPVLDRTGLTGRYDFALNWVPDEFQFAGMKTPSGPQIPANTEGVDLFSAIQQQLGLKLDAMKAPAPVIVVDHVEKPSGN